MDDKIKSESLSAIQLKALKHDMFLWLIGIAFAFSGLLGGLLWSILSNIAESEGRKGVTLGLVERIVEDDDFQRQVINKISTLPSGTILLSEVECEKLTPGNWINHRASEGRFFVAAGEATDINGKLMQFIVGEPDIYGEYVHQLKRSEMPPHKHDVIDNGHVHYVPWIGAKEGPEHGMIGFDGNLAEKGFKTTKPEPSGVQIKEEGDGESHNNIPPYYSIYSCIQK